MGAATTDGDDLARRAAAGAARALDRIDADRDALASSPDDAAAAELARLAELVAGDLRRVRVTLAGGAVEWGQTGQGRSHQDLIRS